MRPLTWCRKVVTQGPLDRLWTDAGETRLRRRGRVTCAEIRETLRRERIIFVIATIGCGLVWVPLDQCFATWKQCKTRIPEDDDARLENFPDGWFYRASTWDGDEAYPSPVILLEIYH